MQISQRFAHIIDITKFNVLTNHISGYIIIGININKYYERNIPKWSLHN